MTLVQSTAIAFIILVTVVVGIMIRTADIPLEKKVQVEKYYHMAILFGSVFTGFMIF